MDKNYKLLIPKYLIILRIVVCFLLIILKLLNLNTPFLICTLAIITIDIGGNYLSKLWKTTSKKTNLLNLITDKLFLLVLTGCFMFKYHILIIIFVLELITNTMNFIFFYKTKKTEILNIGKIKSFTIIINCLLFTLLMFFNININIHYGFCYSIINLQLLSIIKYIIFYISYIKPSINDNKMHKKIMESNDKELEKTIVLDEIKDLENKIYDYEQDQL